MNVTVTKEDIEDYQKRCRDWYNGLIKACLERSTFDVQSMRLVHGGGAVSIDGPRADKYRAEHPFPKFFPDL